MACVQHLRKSVLALTVFVVAGAQVHAQERWPQFRGPQARGISAESISTDGSASDSKLPDQWTATDNIAWKTDIPGRGWSSPVVWDRKVFLTTVVNSEAYEPAKKGLYFGGERKPPTSVHQWKVLCLDLESGEVLWEKQVHEGVPKSSIHIKSSFASETPVTDGKRVYCCFGSLGIFCLDFEGNQIWRYDLEALPTRLGWGAAASPVLHEGRLYLCNDNEKTSYLVCLDAQTGKEIWKVAREEKSNWATPFVWTNPTRTEIVTAGTGQVRSYDLQGNLLWSLKGMSSITIATPYQADGLLYVTSGYVADQTRPIYAIKPGASGDISLSEGITSSESIAWSVPKGAPYNPSTLVYHGRLYVLYDAGLFACYDSATGKEIYSRQRIPNGRAFTTSPWAYGNKIFCLNEDGKTFVIQAGDEFKVLSINELEEDDMGMASPAILSDRILVRTANRIYCIARKP
ncbi:MAG: PQQ-binding-like beta-propeller repeat protein [Planctomycetota bacterium]|jgi:outer membrane protein assembly factor BamB